MTDLTPGSNKRDEDIDLMDLFRRMGRTLTSWIKGLGVAFLVSLAFILRRWWILGLSVIVGIAASFFMKTTSASFYTSDIVIRNNLADIDKITHRDNSGTTPEIISKVNKLHTFCMEVNSSGLSEAIAMRPELVKNISDISAFWIIDQSRDGIPDFVDYKGNHSVYDTINVRMQDRFDIRVKINSPQDLNLVRNGIIKFIEDDSLYQQRNRLRLKQNEELLTRYNYDILELDSLQKVKYFEETRNMKPANGGQIIFMQEQKTQLVYGDIYILYAKKQLLEADKTLYKGIVTVLSDFSSPTKRDNGAMYYGKYIIPAFFLLTLLGLILLKNMRKLRDLLDKY